MAQVALRNLRKQFGNAVAVADFSLGIADGEMVAFLGPSGCGKTTTLRMIAGFVEPSGGSIEIGGRDVTSLPPDRRNTGMVFQRYALFPHMTVAQNVEFGLKMRKLQTAERDARIREALDMVRMTQLRDRYPRQLSGGQQQRVAIARALAVRPEVFLLDEPLSNLDAKLRVEVRDEIRALQQRLGLTTIFVTHDQEEALTIADRLAVMHDGRVQQIGTADALYERPANHFVADFLGKMNFFEGGFDQDGRFVTRRGTPIALGTLRDEHPAARVIGLRPERLALGRAPVAHAHCVPIVVSSLVYMGATLEVRATTEHGDPLIAHLQNNALADPAHLTAGGTTFAHFRSEDCVLFD
ncbi:ABC transporter ATP-binding protein [Paraburkholderia sp.]|uniref:ABC transporter ATP-binding protein n=1 Tax=Paraburkholderia sp. TaxID=1926495 RepID=UPI0039E3E4B1